MSECLHSSFSFVFSKFLFVCLVILQLTDIVTAEFATTIGLTG